jgi:hypothetical protein
MIVHEIAEMLSANIYRQTMVESVAGLPYIISTVPIDADYRTAHETLGVTLTPDLTYETVVFQGDTLLKLHKGYTTSETEAADLHQDYVLTVLTDSPPEVLS